MITLSVIAQMLSEGLTAQLNDPNIEFKIWPNAGEMQKNIRSGNTVTAYIQGTLRSTSSSNEANILSMGYNGLALDIGVPVYAPKTLSTQTAAQLAKIVDSQYPFVTLVLAAIDSYFSVASVFTEEDTSGTEYTISMVAGRATTGNPEIAATLGNALTVTVFIGLNFLQGGISARNIALNIDGKRVPFSSITIGRALQKASDVYSGSTDVLNLASASALSIDFAFPANSDNTTTQVFNTLLIGNANSGHFVELDIDSAFDGWYMMIFDNLNLNGENVLFAGITGSLIQCAPRIDMLDFPDYVQIGYFSFTSSQTDSVTFTASAAVPAFIAGGVIQLTAGENTVSIPASAFEYDPDTDAYRLYMVTLGQVAVTNSSVPFTVLQEAQNG